MTVIRKEIHIRAPREKVWRHFADADLLAAWMMHTDFSGKSGETFHFHGRPSGEWNGEVMCRLLEFEPPSKIAFTWNANTIGADTVVTVELEARDDGTVVRLTHANFERASGDVENLLVRHNAGWDDHLSVLLKQAEDDAGTGPLRYPDPDWTQFNLHVAIDAAPEDVLRHWSTARGMEDFFVEMMRITGPDGSERDIDETARPGDRYTWRWHSGYRLSGEYLPSAAGNEVRFTFGESTVALQAVPHANGCLLRLSQYGIPESENERMHVHVNCRAAWVYFLTVLKIRIEHGIDGRDTTRETGASFSTAFDPGRIGLMF
jgi:uncharacterized protein YndB with AHSA1/START domain